MIYICKETFNPNEEQTVMAGSKWCDITNRVKVSYRVDWGLDKDDIVLQNFNSGLTWIHVTKKELSKYFTEDKDKIKYTNNCYNRILPLRIGKGFKSRESFVEFINNELGFKVSNSLITKLELHKHENPTYGLVSVLSDYFGVTADYLMGKTNYNVTEDKAHLIPDGLEPEGQLLLMQFEEKLNQLKEMKRKEREGRK